MSTLILTNLKNNKLYYFLILLGYIATIFTISLSTSLVNISKDITVDFNQGDLNKQRIIEVSSDKDINIDEIIGIVKEFRSDNAITIRGISYRKVIDEDNDESWTVPVELIAFNEKPSWIPIISDGRYFLPEESMGNDRIAVVGTGVILNKIGSKNEIDILGDKFKVIGNVGEVRELSDYLGTVFLPINCLPSSLKDDIKLLEIKLYNDNGNIDEQKEMLFEKLTTNSDWYIEEVKVSSNNQEYYRQLSKSGVLSLLISIIAIANISTLIYFIVSKNRKNLIISIAMGMSKRILIKQLFYTLMILAVISGGISLIIQYATIPLIKSNLTRMLNISNFQINSMNIIVSMIAIIVISLVISMISVKSIYKEDLSKELKND